MKTAAVLALFAPAAFAGGPVAWTSDRAGARFSPIAVETSASDGSEAVFEIDPSRPLQHMDGFGASFMEAGMIALNSLPPEKRDEVLRSLFDPAEGAAFSLMKTPIAGTDFMSAGPWYSYNDHAGDAGMIHFDASRDFAPDGVGTYISASRRFGKFRLQATMDYPPDWMLEEVTSDQDIHPSHFPALALYQKKYLNFYQSKNIPIDFLSPFNEPSIYTKIPAWKIRDYIRDHLGPALRGSGTRLMLPESPNRRAAWDNHPVIMDDPAARSFISVMPYHGYNEGGFSRVSALAARYPEVPLWMTEVCHGYVVRTPRVPPLPRHDFDDGGYWGNMIISDIEAGASAWIYWNMILDEKGGPWLVSPAHGNPEDNVQQPLVIINRGSGAVTHTGAYWHLSHFSRKLPPGSRRVTLGGGGVDGLRALAFVRPDGSRVAVILNNRATAVRVAFRSSDSTASLTAGPFSITTLLWP